MKLPRKPKLKRIGTFPCDRCGKMFKRTDHLLRHIRETHNNIKKVKDPQDIKHFERFYIQLCVA